MNTANPRVPVPAGPRAVRTPLLAGGLSSLLATTCCTAPLLLVALGFSGAWIGNLAVLEPYAPLFTGLALASLSFAGWRIWRPVKACAPGEACADAGAQRNAKLLFGVVALLVLGVLAFPYLAPRVL